MLNNMLWFINVTEQGCDYRMLSGDPHSGHFERNTGNIRHSVGRK